MSSGRRLPARCCWRHLRARPPHLHPAWHHRTMSTRGKTSPQSTGGSFAPASTSDGTTAAARYTDEQFNEVISPSVPGTTRQTGRHTAAEWAAHGIPAGDIAMWERRGFDPQTARQHDDSFADLMREEERQVRTYLDHGISPEKAGRWIDTNVSPELAGEWEDDPRPDRVATAAASNGMTPAQHDAWVAALDTSMDPPDGMSAEGAEAQANLASDGYGGWTVRDFTPDEAQKWWQGKHRVNCQLADNLRSLGVSPEAYDRAMDKEPYRREFSRNPPSRSEHAAAVANHVKRVNG